jgi:hypothetical protein
MKPWAAWLIVPLMLPGCILWVTWLIFVASH